MSEDEAATLLQGMLRRRNARRRIRELLKSTVEKVVGEDGVAYYVNQRTGESSWVKPAALGEEDVLTGRSLLRRQLLRYGRRWLLRRTEPGAAVLGPVPGWQGVQ